MKEDFVLNTNLIIFEKLRSLSLKDLPFPSHANLVLNQIYFPIFIEESINFKKNYYNLFIKN